MMLHPALTFWVILNLFQPDSKPQKGSFPVESISTVIVLILVEVPQPDKIPSLRTLARGKDTLIQAPGPSPSVCQ